MNLYATVTSERASKGQGGNKEIEIKLQAGPTERKQVARILFIASEHVSGRYELRIYDEHGLWYRQYDLHTTKGDVPCCTTHTRYNDDCVDCRLLNPPIIGRKGEKQKGERDYTKQCPVCWENCGLICNLKPL